MQWRRRTQISAGSNVVLDNLVVGGLLPKIDVSALALHPDASEHPLFYWQNGDRERIVTRIADRYRETISASIGDADEVCEHIFNFLGSGKVHLGDTIDWHQDFKSGHRWPTGFYADIAQIPPEKRADVKVPRELSRCHHFVTLGKAYWYTNDEKYARGFVNQLTDWINRNPPRMTVNWCSAMDVAIRLVNWIWAYQFFTHSPQFDEDSKKTFLKTLFVHAEFVSENLEYYGELSDNHYVSNIVGLAIFGTLFPQFKRAGKWQRMGVRKIFDEIFSQVHDDGVHFEGSINYHRLVLEMFVSALVLCMKNGVEVPEAVWRRLEKMFEFLLYYLKPDGSAPHIGDTDNGRLQALSSDKTLDHRYLLAGGAVLFERPDFKRAARRFHEEAFWLLGEEGLQKFDTLNDVVNPLPSKAFPQGGFYFMRNDQLYMAVRCGANGRRGIGNHSHNDALSFELYAYDKSFIVDPGTYVYTPEPQWRNLFRSTAYHNTLVVDGEEINRIPDDLFRLMDDASPVVNKWESTDKADFLDAQHNGYKRLRDPVTHRRQFYFDKVENYWLIRDLLTGHGTHTLSWSFHFDAGIELAIEDGLTVQTLCPQGANLALRAIPAGPSSLGVEDGWVSPGYGIKRPARIVKYTCAIKIPAATVFVIYPYKGQAGRLSIPSRVMHSAQECWEDLA